MSRTIPIRGLGPIALDVASVISMCALVIYGLIVAPADAIQGDAQRLMYVHVPAAWVAYLAFIVTTLASALWLWPKTRSVVWDHLAGASAEVGVLFIGLTLALGSIWGRPVWGVWWTWDARLVTTGVLFFLYLGYLSLRRVDSEPTARARRSAIAALIAAIDIPIVHFAVDWWRTLHQGGTVFNAERDAQIEGIMGWTLLLGFVSFTLVYGVLVNRRFRLAVLEEGRMARELEVAIAQRVGAEPGGSR